MDTSKHFPLAASNPCQILLLPALLLHPALPPGASALSGMDFRTALSERRLFLPVCSKIVTGLFPDGIPLMIRYICWTPIQSYRQSPSSGWCAHGGRCSCPACQTGFVHTRCCCLPCVCFHPACHYVHRQQRNTRMARERYAACWQVFLRMPSLFLQSGTAEPGLPGLHHETIILPPACLQAPAALLPRMSWRCPESSCSFLKDQAAVWQKRLSALHDMTNPHGSSVLP